MQFHDLHPPQENLLQEVKKGLHQRPKNISPKFFYDQRGSNLFTEITKLPEYYVTKVEMEILKNQGKEIAEQVGTNLLVVEYGCGNSEKIHHLLDFLQNPKAYLAIDISKSSLLELAQGLTRDYPKIEIIAVCADFTKPLELPLNGRHSPLPRLAFFPGSSIGNFEPPKAIQFMKTIREEMGSEGGLLIGVDLKKDPQLLHQAYNDSQGLTEAFNKNLLIRLNRECRANFELDKFQHRAFYNEEAGRIEMHLVSRSDQSVQLGEEVYPFQKGETIHTENSYKYHVEEFQDLAKQAHWKPRAVWTDPKALFSLHYYR